MVRLSNCLVFKLYKQEADPTQHSGSRVPFLLLTAMLCCLSENCLSCALEAARLAGRWKHCWRAPPLVARELGPGHTPLVATLAIQRFILETVRSLGGHLLPNGSHLEINQKNI